MNPYLHIATWPARIESVANKREHWATKARRTKRERSDAHYQLWHQVDRAKALRGLNDVGLTVTMVRIAPRQLDSDNLASAFKATRDGVADFLGIQDNDVRVAWLTRGERGKTGEYAVRVEISEVPL